jgi:RNA polymerase sigma-70 factor (ECF subfamily)
MHTSATRCTPDATTADAPGWPQISAHRDALVRFARRRLRDPSQAEDVVHDTFEAVMTRQAAFEGRSSLRSWLIGVLKHKIVDHVRRNSRCDSLDDLEDGAAPLEMACPHARPEELAELRQRLTHTLARIDRLPPALRDAMHLRVLQDEPTATVCRVLAINETNLFVRLHRARRQLLC